MIKLPFLQKFSNAHLCKDIFTKFATFDILVLWKTTLFLTLETLYSLGHLAHLAKHVYGMSLCSDTPVLARGPLQTANSAHARVPTVWHQRCTVSSGAVHGYMVGTYMGAYGMVHVPHGCTSTWVYIRKYAQNSHFWENRLMSSLKLSVFGQDTVFRPGTRYFGPGTRYFGLKTR